MPARAKPAGADTELDPQDLPAGRQEDQVEREAHPEGVDRAAALEQQARPRALAIEVGQPEQAQQRVTGDGNLDPEDRAPRGASEAPGLSDRPVGVASRGVHALQTPLPQRALQEPRNGPPPAATISV